jgi:hypothetical protein
VLSRTRATEFIREIAQPDDPHRTQLRRVAARAGSTITAFGSVVAGDADGVRPAVNATPLAMALNWNRLARAELSEASYSRLFAIASRPDGWRGRGSKALSAASLSVFLKFWSVVSRDAAEPQFALMPTGHLSAEWFKNRRRHLDLEFADDWMIYFGLFNGDGISEGKETIQNLANILKSTSFKPLLWTCKK